MYKHRIYLSQEVIPMFTTIQKWGNSQAVRLPKAVLEKASLKENDAVGSPSDAGSNPTASTNLKRKGTELVSFFFCLHTKQSKPNMPAFGKNSTPRPCSL
jgi:hypothetical protein